jgi:hypothetical protein
MKCISMGLNAIPFEHLFDNLRHRKVLEDALVKAVLQVIQCRHQRQGVTRQSLTGFTHSHLFNTAMNTLTFEAELKKCRLAEQTLHIKIRALTDQLHLDRIQHTDRFKSIKGKHLEVIGNIGDQQREMRSVGGREHMFFLTFGRGCHATPRPLSDRGISFIGQR